MIPIVCVDNRMGMLFNNRRLSRDRLLTEWIINYAGCIKVWCNSFSKELFVNYNVICDENFIYKAGEKEYCFIENIDISQMTDLYNEVIVCKWNRDYPSDVKFNLCNEEKNWDSMVIDEIIGSSHDKITIERWRMKL